MGNIQGFTAGYGKRLASRRSHLNLTQKDIAARVGINKMTVSHWEKERQTPSAYIFKLCDCLNVTPSWLMTGEDATPPHQPLDTNGNGKAHDTPQGVDSKGVIRTEITPARGRGGGGSEFSPLSLTQREAVAGLQWLRAAMRDMPRESEAWPALQGISRELGRLCAPRSPQSLQAEERQGGDSDEASEVHAGGVEAQVGKFQ